MANDLMIPQNFGGLPSEYAHLVSGADVLGEHVVSGYAVLGIKGKNYWFKQGGEDTLIEREDGSGDPATSIPVIIVKAADRGSKTYYQNGYDDRNREPPTCYSSDGIRPDASIDNPVNAACATCPMNRPGSKVSDNGKKVKACSDNWRLAVVPADDPANEIYGGPMLLRVPAASLGDMQTYGRKVAATGNAYFTVRTILRFDPTQAYPKLLYTAERTLTPEELAIVIPMRDDPKVQHILQEASEFSGAEDATDAATPAPAPAPAPAPRAAPVKPAPAKAVNPPPAATAPKPAPKPAAAAPKPAPAPAPKPAPAPAPKPAAAAPKPAPTKPAPTKPAPTKPAPVPPPAPVPEPEPEPELIIENGHYWDVNAGEWVPLPEDPMGVDAAVDAALDSALDAAFA